MPSGPHTPIAPARPGHSPTDDMAGPRVALVHDWLTGMRGGEKCLDVLCRLFPDAPLHTLIYRRGALSPAIEARAIQTSPLQLLPGVFRHYRHLLPLMPLAAKAWRPRDVDLVLSLSHCVAKAVAAPPGVPHLCYCFTPMRYAWDGRDAYLEAWRKRPLLRALAGAALDRLRAWDRANAAGVTQFVAISETVRRRIEACYDRESVVIPPPVNTAFFRPDPDSTGSNREGPYLCVSALVPYKQIEHAVRACSATRRPLIVIGEGPERPRLERIAGPTVRFLGWQPDEVVREHYRTCRALLFPGEEDFGIVPVEALACGAPVIALGRGGAAETIDNHVGLLYDDASPKGLHDAIRRFEQDGGQREPRVARLRAEAHSEERFRNRMNTLIHELISRNPRTETAHKRLPDRRHFGPWSRRLTS